MKKVCQDNIDRPVKLTVYSSKDQSFRGMLLRRWRVHDAHRTAFLLAETKLTPSNTWGGKGLLGLNIRFCSFEGASENVWHVLVRV